jgi:hypothetical protein
MMTNLGTTGEDMRKSLFAQTDNAAQLVLMAADPEIRNELVEISEDFLGTEADGLELSCDEFSDIQAKGP